MFTQSIDAVMEYLKPSVQTIQVQINGCFWHNHECKFMRIPLSNSDYWENKLKRNCDRDTHSNNLLEELGWRILIVWECAIKYASKDSLQKTLEGIEYWIKSDAEFGCIDRQVNLLGNEQQKPIA